MTINKPTTERKRAQRAKRERARLGDNKFIRIKAVEKLPKTIYIYIYIRF